MMTDDASVFEKSIGCQFIGISLELTLYGLTCAQTLYYFDHYRNDKAYLRYLVCFLWVIDSASVVLEGQLAIAFLAYKHADLSALSSPLPTVSLVGLLVEAVAVIIVQYYYLYGTWILGNKRWYHMIAIALMVLLALMSFAATIAFVITDELGAKHKLSGLYTNPVETLELSLFTLSASVVDIYITVTLCWHLRRMRSGLQRTDTLVRRLVVYAVDRGILTTTMQLLSLITYLPLAEKPVYLWTVFHLPASKLYVNSMLAVLNARQKLGEAFLDDVELCNRSGELVGLGSKSDHNL